MDHWNGQQEDILKARANGFIDDMVLAKILASDPQYIETLPVLWQRFSMNLRKQMPEQSTFEDRVTIWLHLILRWTSGTICGPIQHDIKMLPLKVDQPGRGSIQLLELKAFFESWQIPLPKFLYGPFPAKVKKKKLRPDQKAKRGVLEIGKKMREKDPNITKVDIANSEEVKNACIRIAKKEFHPRVISERWLKDL